IAGPLAGFAMLLAPLMTGVWLSKVVPGVGFRGDLIFGTPLILKFFEWLRFPGVPDTSISLHPVARAPWARILATRLNLLPIGQLDGGHLLFSFLGARTKWLSCIFVAVLACLGAYQLFTTAFHAGMTWIFWAALLLIFALRHPAVYDPNPIGRTRSWL